MYGMGTGSTGLASRPGIRERSNSDIKQKYTTLENGKAGIYLLASSPQVPPSVERMAQPLRGLVNSPSFFHAKQTPTQLDHQRPVLPKKTSSFVYANGEEEASPLAMRPGNPATSRSESFRSQGFYTHFGPEIQPSNHIKSSINFKLQSQSSQVSWQSLSSTFFRAASPPKENIHLSYRKGASQIIRPTVTVPASPSAASQPSRRSSVQLRRRQSSLDTVPDQNHCCKKVHSVSSTSSSTCSKLPRTDSSTRHLTKSPSMIGMDHHVLSLEAAAQDLQTGSSSGGIVNVPSPGSSEKSNSPQYSDLAANARRERKVLDLEISNSSLLAINRSLEKEVQKQKAELRRIKRISRNTNRTSWLSYGTSNSSLGRLSALDEDTDGLSTDLKIEELDLDRELSGEDSLDEEAMSPGALAQSDARHRKSDVRRLKLDLSKHKEMLVDSQKMNQSLKRCFGMTDQLIQDGNKALEYQVRISEVPLGGRILSPEELEPYAMCFDGAIDSEDGDSYFKGWQRSRTTFVEPDSMDKDSGVDLLDQAQMQWQPQRVPSSTLSEMMREMF